MKPRISVPKGTKFGMWSILKEVPGKRRRFRCKCECGNIRDTDLANLRNGSSVSCGCVKPNNRTHGMSAHPLYDVYMKMLDRCYNKNSKDYKWYGAKGITVCKHWRNDKQAFFNWAKPKWEKGLQLDRLHNDKSYSPSNCHFTTSLQNNNNRSSNSLVNFKGKDVTIAELTRICGGQYGTIRHRIVRLGMDAETATRSYLNG